LSGAVVQGLAMGAFLLVGKVWPRDRALKLVNPAALRNLFNGLLLFGFRVTLIAQIAPALELGLWDPSWLKHPITQFIVGLLCLDFCRYWLHRAHHRVPWLWAFHRVHHSAESLDSTTGLRMHLVDFLQLALLPLVLFGLILDTAQWADWVLPSVLAVGVVFDAFEHGNIRWNPRHPFMKVWGKVLNHPHFHAWHHTQDALLCDGNYGNALVIWDKCFGTDVTQDDLPESLGLGPSQALEESLTGWWLLRRRARG
jgi:sterol desaturase/sphingolipid hydroxylase (fatty acid hydroxylase superfamily)